MTRRGAVVGSLGFFVLVPGTVAGLVPWWLSGWRLRPPFLGVPALRILGAVLIAGGAVALLEAFARFALHGLGTPAPVLPTRHLVVTGSYRHVRNPMYVAVLAVIVGQALLLGDPCLLAYGLLVWLVVHLFIVGYEEPTLRRRFGADYEAFRTNVPRWIPRLRGWSGR